MSAPASFACSGSYYQHALFCTVRRVDIDEHVKARKRGIDPSRRNVAHNCYAAAAAGQNADEAICQHPEPRPGVRSKRGKLVMVPWQIAQQQQGGGP